MGKKRSFKIGEQIVDIPEAEVGQFLSDVPDAKEVQSFVIGKDTVDIPVAEVETFKADVPEAKPLFEQEPPEQGDTIPIPVVPTRNPLNPPQQDPEGPELPSVSMDEQGNMSRTVEMQRKQRDAILNSAFKVPEDIRSNPVFGKRYVMDVSRKTGIPENAVKQVYEQGERDYQEYNKLKADFDIGKGTDEDLNKMGGLLLNLGRYDEAIQAYKTLEGRLMQMGIKEYQPGMRQDYIDQRQAPAFIGILNAVYAKGDMKEYERLLKIADVKGLDFVKEYKQAIEESQNNGTPLDLRLSGLPSVGTGTSAQPGNEMTYDNSGQMVPVGTPEYRRTFENSKEADYINSIADAVGSLTGLPQTVEMTTHGAEKVGKSFQNQFGNPWKSKGVGETVSNYLGMLTGAVETVLAPAAFSTPVGAGAAVALPQLPPKVQEYLMLVSKIVRDAYDGKPPANAENLAILGDILTVAVLHVGATGVKEYVTSGGMGRDVVSAKLTLQLLLNEIKEIPPEQVREMVAEAEKRFEATGGDQKVYTELVRDRAQGAVDELKAIEHSAEPEPYNPEPAPESLRTVPEGADVEYEGKKGTLDRGDDGTWYFTDDEGKSTQIPVEDKYNPQEKLSELGIQVLPEVSKEAVARAVADAEQVGEVEYKGKRYFVSLDNPMKENPTGDLVFERTSDGRMLNRFDSHPDPTFAQNRKLAIVNKFLADKGLPPREGLIEPWKEAKTKEPAAPVSAEIAPEDAVTPEGVKMVEEVESKKADIERRRQEELEKPYKTVNDGSGKMVTVTTETTENEGVKKTKFKTETTNSKGEPRTQNDKGYNNFEEAVENLQIDVENDYNKSGLELVSALKENAKGRTSVRVVEIRESTDKSSPFYGSRTATVIVNGEAIEFRLKNDAELAPEGAVTPEVAVGGGVPESKVTVDALADVETPEGFTNRVFESNMQLGEAPNDAHISEEGYNYRVLSQNEINAISESGGVFARDGKQKGGNKNTKYWTKGNNKNWYGDKDNLETIRVKQDSFKDNEVVRAENVEVYNKETKQFEPLIKKDSKAPTQYTEAATPAKKESGGVSGSALKDVGDIKLKNGNKLVINKDRSVKAGKNFAFDENSYDVQDKDGNNIGSVHISDRGDYYQISNIKLKNERTGLGTEIYKTIIQKLDKPLISDKALSEKAKGLWNKLVNEGVAEKFKDTFELGGKTYTEDRYRTKAPTQYTEAATPAKKESGGVSGSALKDVDLGGGIKNKATDEGVNLLPISEIDNLRSQKQTDLATGNAVEMEKDLSKNGIKEPLVITYYPNEGKAVLTDGHNRLDVAKDMGAEKLPIRIVERYTDAPNNAKDWTPPQEDASTQSTTVEVPRSETPRAASQVAEGSPEKLQKPTKEEKPLTIAQERKQKVYKAKTMTPVDFKQAVLRFALSPGGSIKLADAIHNTGYKTKDFPPFMMGKDGIPMHKVWEIMKGDEEISHLIPDDNHDFNNKFFEVITKYHSTKDMWADFLKNADTGEWETHGFPSQEAYERELMGRMEAASEGIEYDDIPKQLIEDVEREVDAMPDEAVEQMLKDLDENAPQEVYEERTNNGPEEVVAESETGSPKGEDLNEIAKEQQKRDADKAVEQELAKAKKELEQAKTTLESKRKQVDERIAQEQQQEMFAEPKAENPLEGDFEAGARADALKAELNAYEAAQKKYAELRGKQKAEVMKKIDDFEQWVLNLPGIKDMSGGAEKAGIGAAEIVKGMAEAVRKAVEAGFDIADALHDAIEKYKKLSPEFFAAVSEKDIRDRFGVKEEAFAASNAASKKMREELGIPQDAEFTAQNRRDVEAVMAGAKNLKERSVNPKDLVDKVIWENHMLNAEEQQFLVQHEIDLFNERKGLEKKLDALLSKEVDPKQYMLKSVMPAADEFTTIQQRVDQIRSEQAQVLAALEKAGSEQSLVFRMRQLINRRDYSVENSIRTYMALFGREPSQRAKEFFAAKEKEIAQIEEQRTALADKAKEAELQGIIDGLREELAREKARNAGKPVLTQKEIQRKKELKQKFAGVFNDVTNIAAALADKEFYEYAGIIFKETVGDVKNFTKRLIDELGPKVAPHAQEIFDRVKKSQYEEPEYRNNRLWIDPNMLREIVREGVENHTELSQRVYDIVKDTYPDVTMREVQESISGYGKTINPKLSELDRELNSLKRDMKLAVSLEDAQAGKGVKRSGYQPAPLTDSQREMMRTIREELKNYPQDEAAVEKKWKTALDKVKTGLRNAITDAEKRLDDLRAGRAVESRERKQIELDETALQMKEHLADLKKQLKDIEGEKVKTPEQIVREAVSALEKSEREYQERVKEIRTTGTYTPKVKRQVSGPAIDAARLARDLAKDEFERALETTDYPRQAAASKALSAAEAKLRALEDKIAAGDVSFRKRIMSLVDTENPLLKATKEQIKIKQDMIKAMREASGEADRHAVELWKARKQRRIDELNTKKANKDFTTKAQRELPIDEEMKRLAAAATRAKFEYDVAFELAKMENMSKVDKLKELGYDLYEFPKSIMASMDLSAVMRQGGILSARHPIQTITNTIPKMLKMFAKESFHKEWYDNLVHSGDYISVKESGLFLNEPNAKITAREEQAASRIAAAIPGVGASNRAYSGFLNMQRMQAFSDFKNACINAGVKGDMLRAELRNYADFINKATGRGSFGRLETSVPILNTLFFAPRFAISRFQLLTKTLTGFYNTPKARIEAYKAMGSWAAAIGSTVAIFKMVGYEVNTDMNSSDFLKVKRGNQTYDPWSGMQQPFVLLARTLMGSSKSVRGEEKELNKGGTTYKDVWERYLRSKAAPLPGMVYDAAKGKTMDNQPFKWIPESGEDVAEGRSIASLIMPLIIQETIKEGKTDGIPTAVMNLLPNMVGIGVQTIYLNELKDKSKLEPDVRKLMDQSGFYPNQSNDTEVYVDDKPYEISADELTKIRELRLQKAGEIINRWYGNGKFDGLTKTEIHALFKKAYNRADGEAKDDLLPEGWTNKKPKPEEEVFEVK